MDKVSVPAGRFETSTPETLCDAPEMTPEPVTEPAPPLDVMAKLNAAPSGALAMVKPTAVALASVMAAVVKAVV